jgi:hypothetical protein
MKELKYILLAGMLALAPFIGCGSDDDDDNGDTTEGTTDDPPASFCDNFAATCDGIATIDDCATWWDAAPDGQMDDTSGASKACYTYHLGVAATDAESAAIHCPHAAGAAPCVDGEGTTDEGTTDEGTTDEGTTDEGTTDEGTTDEGTTDEGTTDEGTTDEGTTDEGTTDEGTTDEGTTDEGTTDDPPEMDFCAQFDMTCQTPGFAEKEDCAAWWEAADDGEEGAVAGASKACYSYHLGVAGGSDELAAEHCPHAAGGAPCTDPETSFCDEFVATCDGLAEITDCAAWWEAADDGEEGAVAGASKACYSYHLGVAGGSDELAAEHCPHAAGGAPCN